MSLEFQCDPVHTADKQIPKAPMIDYLVDAAASFQTYAGRIFTASLFILTAELLFPRSRYSITSRIRGAIFWLNYIVITALALTLFGRLWGSLGLRPLLTIDLNFLSSSPYSILRLMGGAMAALIAIQMGEFFYYWFHRLQHTSKFLWTFHAEHHSLEEMSALNSNHHFTEEVFRIPFVLIPMTLLVHFEQGYVPWIWATLLGWQGIYEHSSTKLHLGWFRYIVPDNRFHRIHHSRDPKHFNKNFGSGSAIWDLVFRTVHHPKHDEWPDVGLTAIREPANLREFLFRPILRTAARVGPTIKVGKVLSGYLYRG